MAMLAWVNRKRREAPFVFSPAGLRLVGKAFVSYYSENGSLRLLSLYLVPPFPGFTFSYWLSYNSDDYFQVPLRIANLKMWQALRILGFSGGLLSVYNALFLVLVDQPPMPYPLLHPRPLGLLLFGVSSILCIGVIPTTANRQRAIAALLRFAQTPEERTAAGIASVLGKRRSDLTFEMAARTFRTILFSDLTGIVSTDRPPHLLATGERPTSLPITSSLDELFNMSRHTALGECEAFICHAYGDDPNAKWEALSRWAAAVQSAQGRSPSVWLGTPSDPSWNARSPRSLLLALGAPLARSPRARPCALDSGKPVHRFLLSR